MSFKITSPAQDISNNVEIINPITEGPYASGVCLPKYDAFIIHYSIFILGEYYLPGSWREVITKFRGCKIQIIQDEYRQINEMKEAMLNFGFSWVFSSLGKDNLRKVYSPHSVPAIKFVSCLPGYVPDRLRNRSLVPIDERPFDIIYRGRKLPFVLGAVSQAKGSIGEVFRSRVAEYGLEVDIASDESDRLYGEDWDEFLSSGRSMLGTPGGASLYDFDGSIARSVDDYIEKNPGALFEEVSEALLQGLDGKILHQTITPKIIEAAALGTVLILLEGDYRSRLRPGKHYLEIKKDYSNVDEICEKLSDTGALKRIAQKARQRVLSAREFRFETYVKAIDYAVSKPGAPGPRRIRL